MVAAGEAKSAVKYETRLFINNEYVEGTGKRLTVRNPNNETIVTEDVQTASEADVEKAFDAAQAAYKGEWSKWTASQRSAVLMKVAELIEKEAGREGTDDDPSLPHLETVAMGAPVQAGKWILGLCAEVFKYYAGWTNKIPGEQYPADDGTYKIVSYEPLGVCAGIGAWNVSYILLANKIAPALAAGNTFIFKASEKSPLGCIRFARIFKEAGIPAGVVNVITGGGDVGALLASHPRIRKISFTGSVPTGKKIQAAAANSNLKRVTLELGGKSPALVFEDADLENAYSVCADAFLFNTTQACIASSRCFVQESIAPAFIEGMKKRFASLGNNMGDPSLETTSYGPLADQAQYDRVMSFIEAGKKEAELAIGGERVGEKGHFIKPTIFLNAKDDASIYRDEIFGPVLGIRTFKTEEEAIELANDTNYGLSSVLLTKSISRALRVSRQIEAGTVAINQSHSISVSAPFGGFKESGVGRESGREGIMGYLQSKTILIGMGV
ncbi:aldehyde dehydrogenase [Pseudovirgaria hyperparasitica]|uniref:aldehyde dehydrogenase (NAD(+)) n=1 Tax=Pseudovirgaria hyperparasitica TaxID=470096 RepID=A0A6A6W0P1_9PEZI|nr:aldehyde dehydrogenase [Pseudovirgaria hyperparasitica]KAF2756113.1 aldehyde dehydrogenase [Pseudovirgaria hyperparasitica]